MADIDHNAMIQDADSTSLAKYVAEAGAGATISNKEINTLLPVTVYMIIKLKGGICMKMRKGISAVLAGVMALAALPVSAMSASAEGAYALGDVDMDGFITGHDAAMVTRALYVDNNALNDEQMRLADVTVTVLLTKAMRIGFTRIRC